MSKYDSETKSLPCSPATWVATEAESTLDESMQPDSRALMTEAETAAELGLTKRTLQSWRVSGEGPPFVRLSKRAIRYRRSDVDAWIDERVVNSTSEYTQS